MNISFTVNGNPTTIDVPAKMVLLDILRDRLGLTGAKPGCEIGSCGACTAVVDGEAQNSCTFPASRLAGTAVLTIEGLATPNGSPNDLQQAFLEHGAVQCGYPIPSRSEIRQVLADNICRCTGYVQIVAAIEATAGKRANGSKKLDNGKEMA